jgi:hypothetical protein
MNGKMAKRLRRLAQDEMSGDQGVVGRELVVARVKGHDRVFNNPNSVRAMSLQLKAAYKRSRSSGL